MRFLRSHVLLIWLVAVGAILRVWQYGANPSLELDELALIRNIVNRPLWDLLLTPLLFDQVAPQGFLLAEKTAVVLLGPTEYALRLLPLVCALGSLVLFWRLAARMLQGLAIPLALAVFALKPAFILYGATAKPYAGDVAAVLLLMVLALALRAHSPTRLRCLLVGIVGAVIVQGSQVAVLALIGLGLAIVLLALAQRDVLALGSFSITVGLWAVGAGATVALGLQRITPATHAYLHLHWRDGFMPWPSSWHGMNVAQWLWSRLYLVFDLESLHSTWYEWPGLYVGLAVLGFGSLWRRCSDTFLLLLGPLIITLAAAGAHQYPIKGRLAISLTPLLIMAAAEGAECICRLWSPRLTFVGAIGMALVGALPVYDFVAHLPVYRREETKPMLAYVQERRLHGDVAYVYYGAWQAASFYAARYAFREGEYIIGGCHRGNTRAYLRELERFRGQPRVWVLISHAVPSLQEVPAMIGYLDRIGIRLDDVAIPARIWYKVPGVANTADVQAYLYDLSDGARLTLASAETFEFRDLSRVTSHDSLGCSAGPHVPTTKTIFR